MASRSESHNAYEAATTRLRDRNYTEFMELLDEERVKRGLKPKAQQKAERIARLEAQLANLKGES